MAVKKKPMKKGKTVRAALKENKRARQLNAQQIRALRDGLVRTKVDLAKRSVAPAPRVLRVMPALNVKSLVTTGFNIVARMVEDGDGLFSPKTFLARVPVAMTTIPEVPEVVTLEGKFFVLTTTLPMTYTQRLYSEAKRI